MILKLKNINSIAIKIPFLNDVDINKNKNISSSDKNYKYFIDYSDEYKTKKCSIVFQKASVYVKSCDGGSKWMCFLIKDEKMLKNIMKFGIKSAIV